MNIATLKVYGDETTLADVRDGLPSEPDSDWQKGDVSPSGRTRIDHGFYVAVASDADPDTLMKHIRAYLHECERRGINFDAPDIQAELRITVPAGGSQSSLDFLIADLELLIEMGITLSIMP